MTRRFSRTPFLVPICALQALALAGCGGTGRVTDNAYQGQFQGGPDLTAVPAGAAQNTSIGLQSVVSGANTPQTTTLSITVSPDGGISGTSVLRTTGTNGAAVTLFGTAGGRISKYGDMDMTVSFPETATTPVLSTEYTGPVKIISVQTTGTGTTGATGTTGTGNTGGSQNTPQHLQGNLKMPNGTAQLDLLEV